MGEIPMGGGPVFVDAYEKSSAKLRIFCWKKEEGSYEKSPGKRGNRSAVRSTVVLWVGEALTGRGLVGPLELIAELFDYMLKRLDIPGDPHDVDEGFRAEFGAVVEGVHFAQQGGIRFAHGGGNVFGTKAAFQDKIMNGRNKSGRHKSSPLVAYSNNTTCC